MQKKVYDLKIVKQKIEYFCAYQERCQSEVLSKLNKLGVSSETAKIVLSDLIQNNFVDEERFAETFASGKFRMKSWGKFKIAQHLKQKNVSEYCINKALGSIDQDEYNQVIKALCEKKIAQLADKSNNQFQIAQKVKTYMFSKGFEPELFNQFIPID